jgi:transposase-like protein
LKVWYNEYQFKLDLSAGYAGREPKFSQAQKAAAIEHYLTHERRIAATMRALGYPGRGTLTKWVREVDCHCFCGQISASSSKLLKVHRAQLVEMALPENAILETLNAVKHV